MIVFTEWVLIIMVAVEKNSVSFTKIGSSNIDDRKKAIQSGLNLINFQFPKDARNVVIKPNMCYYWDCSTGHTTDPKFVGALIEVIRDQTSPETNVSIIESDASAMKCKHAFPILGYEKLAKEYKVNLINLAEDKTDDEKVSVNGQVFNLLVPHTIRDADLRINVPKIKYMEKVKITCAMKNIFGCNPCPLKYKYHSQLDEAIVAINKIMKFHLHILDGMILLGTFPRRLDLLMASQDPVAFDSAASKLAGENPAKIKYLNLAQKEGLGQMNYSHCGLDRGMFDKKFPRKTHTERLLSSAYALAIKTGIIKI